MEWCIIIATPAEVVLCALATECLDDCVRVNTPTKDGTTGDDSVVNGGRGTMDGDGDMGWVMDSVMGRILYHVYSRHVMSSIPIRYPSPLLSSFSLAGSVVGVAQNISFVCKCVKNLN